MAKYKVTHPDGTQLIVTGPEGASQEEVIAKAVELYKPKQSQAPLPEEKEVDYSKASWSDVAVSAGKNIIPSTLGLLGDIWDAVSSPIETVENLSQVIGGGVRKGLKSMGVEVDTRPDSEAKFNAVMDHFANTYGSAEGIKKAIAEDPATILADLSAVVSGGGTVVAKTTAKAGTVAKAAEFAAKTGQYLDPLTATVTGLTTAGTKAVGVAAPTVAAFTSGVGKKAIEKAYESGLEGGKALKDFRDNLKGADPQGVLDDALNNLEKLRLQKETDYKTGMKEVSKNKQKVMYNKIDYVLSDVTTQVGKLSDEGLSVVNKLSEKIQQSKDLGYNTPVQLDELKRAVGEIAAGAQGPSKVYASKVRDAIRDTIIEASPEYGKVMEQYGEAAEAMRELKQVLSLQGKGGNPDTALRKLLSVMRDNVQTNYGKRVSVAEELEKVGSANIMAKIAGQELSSVAPKGLLGRVLGGGAVGYGAFSGGLGALMTPEAIVAGAMASPRVIGEVAQLTGQARRKANQAAQVLPSATPSYLSILGRETEEEE
jgi:hypothetical protein